jgi:hypothetical protein
MFKGIESDEFKKASEKFNTFGPLGVTADDHLAIGSTPNQRLINNPGKTLGEIMSAEEINDWLTAAKGEIKKCSSEEYATNSFVCGMLTTIKKNLQLSEQYLLSINKLPVEK